MPRERIFHVALNHVFAAIQAIQHVLDLVWIVAMTRAWATSLTVGLVKFIGVVMNRPGFRTSLILGTLIVWQQVLSRFGNVRLMALYRWSVMSWLYLWY